IVMAVAQGFEAQREPVGKRITARLALADDPGIAIAGRRPL
ncbi:ATP-binding protein, partial [Streptomyces sp. NPDC001286]